MAVAFRNRTIPGVDIDATREMTIAEAAREFGLVTKTVGRWFKKGEVRGRLIPPEIYGGSGLVLLETESIRERATKARRATVHEGIDAIRSGIVERHLEYAEKIAKQHRKTKRSPEDVLQDAYLGLTKAARTFDLKLSDDDFKAYSYKRIKGEILDAERSQCVSAVRVSGKGVWSKLADEEKNALSGGSISSDDANDAVGVPAPDGDPPLIDGDIISDNDEDLTSLQRFVLDRYYRRCVTVPKIAAILGCRSSNVSDQMTKAKRTLARNPGFRADAAKRFRPSVRPSLFGTDEQA